MQGSGSRVQGLGCGVYGVLGFRVQGSGFKGWALGFRAGLGLRGSGFRVQGSGLGLRVEAFRTYGFRV